MDKGKAAELFGVSRKNMQEFNISTPEKNQVEGWICKSHGSNMGSLIISKVNEKDSWQFVRGMPKLKYLDDRDPPTLPYVFHKEDGTNIVMFPLLEDGDCAEVLFKTRLMAGCNQKWMDKIGEVINENYFKAVEYEGLSFSYELYGARNAHETRYDIQDITLRLDLLTILEQGRALPAPTMLKTAIKAKLPTVIEAFDVTKDEDLVYRAVLMDKFINRFMEYLPEQTTLTDMTLEGVYKQMELFFEKLNINFQARHGGGIITEGSVWHYGLQENHMAKCKALSVREGHIKQACGIPHMDIKKAIQKAEENYNGDLEDADKEWVLRFVKEELLEEYEQGMVEDVKTRQKTMSILGKYLRKVQVDSNLLKIVEHLNDECGVEAAPADKMRCFAELYPDMRRESRHVYAALVNM